MKKYINSILQWGIHGEIRLDLYNGINKLSINFPSIVSVSILWNWLYHTKLDFISEAYTIMEQIHYEWNLTIYGYVMRLNLFAFNGPTIIDLHFIKLNFSLTIMCIWVLIITKVKIVQ